MSVGKTIKVKRTNKSNTPEIDVINSINSHINQSKGTEPTPGSTSGINRSKQTPEESPKDEPMKFDRKGNNVNRIRRCVIEKKRATPYILTEDIIRDISHMENCTKRTITRNPIHTYDPHNRKAMDRRPSDWIRHNLSPLVEKLSLESHLFNGMILPEECTHEESWELIRIRELLCIRHLMDIKNMDIQFIVSGIEWSEGSQEEEEDPNPDKVQKYKPVDKEQQEKKEENMTKYVRFSETSEEKKGELLNLFSVRTGTLKICPAKSIGEVYVRMLEFITNNAQPEELNHLPSFSDYIVKYYETAFNNQYFEDLSIFIEKNPGIYQAAWDIITINGVLSAKGPNDVHSRKDYAHIHMAIFFTNRAHNVSPEYVSRYIFNKKIFLDTMVSERTNTRGRKPGGTLPAAMCYAMKNFKHTEPNIRLKRNSCTIYNVKGNPDVDNFFSRFVSDNRIQGFIDGINYTTNASYDINGNERDFNHILAPTYGEHGGIFTPFISQKIYPKIKPKSTKDSDYMINRVREYMEINDLVLSYKSPEDPSAPVLVLQKDPNSKYTFVDYKYGSLDALWKEVKTYYRDVQDILRTHKLTFFEYANEPQQNWFPVVKMCYSWIEYKDFFLHITSGSITREQYHFPSFRFFPNISYKDIEFINKKQMLAPVFYDILKNSGYMTSRCFLTTDGEILINQLFSMFRRNAHKAPATVLIGPPNCGKTMLIMILVLLYPKSKLGHISKSREFGFENLSDCMLLVLEEITAMKREDILKILEPGQNILINKKHISNRGKTATEVRFNTVITANNMNWASFDGLKNLQNEVCIDPAIGARIKVFNMKELSNIQRLETENVSREELGIIMIFMATNFYKGLKDVEDIEQLKQISKILKRWNYQDDKF